MFLTGGVFAPVLHRAQHGLEWHHEKGSDADRCDHSDHGAAFEESLGDLADNPCTLCTVKKEYRTAFIEAFGFSLRPATDSLLRHKLTSTPRQFTRGIRGPPDYFLSNASDMHV